MSITLTPYVANTNFIGGSWTVANEDELAEQIAIVAVGQFRHVQKILAEVGLGGVAAATLNAKAEAVDKLTVPAGADPWHRDGWMFQVMSWIAAVRRCPDGLFLPPHMIHASKGFDGLQLEIDASDGTVSAAIIFEDKATESPRKTILQDVWPEFERFEAGRAEANLTAAVTSLLMTKAGVDADAAIRNIVWKKSQRYRVCITVDSDFATPEKLAKLFGGYDKVALGAPARRRAETFEVQALRPWMAGIAQKAILAVGKLPAKHV